MRGRCQETRAQHGIATTMAQIDPWAIMLARLGRSKPLYECSALLRSRLDIAFPFPCLSATSVVQLFWDLESSIIVLPNRGTARHGTARRDGPTEVDSMTGP